MVPFAVMERTYLSHSAFMVGLWSESIQKLCQSGLGKELQKRQEWKKHHNIMLRGHLSSHLWQVLLIHPPDNSCALCLKERKKGPEDQFELYLHSHYECRSMTNLNTDLKALNPETTASATMVPSGHPLGKLDTFLSQHIPAAVVPTNELYSKI